MQVALQADQVLGPVRRARLRQRLAARRAGPLGRPQRAPMARGGCQLQGLLYLVLLGLQEDHLLDLVALFHHVQLGLLLQDLVVLHHQRGLLLLAPLPSPGGQARTRRLQLDQRLLLKSLQRSALLLSQYMMRKMPAS